MATKVTTDVIESVPTTKLTGTITNAQLAGGITNDRITSINTSKLVGTISNAQLASGISASKLTGTLPALDGSALSGVEPPTDFNAVGTYRIIRVNSTQSADNLFNGIGNTFSTSSYGLSASHTYRHMGAGTSVVTGTIGQTTYDHGILIVRVA